MPATIWAVHDGKIGMANQTLGLAEAVAPALQATVVEKSLRLRAPWRWLPPHAWLAPLAAVDPRGDRLAPPWPDMLISCGRLVAAPARAAKRASRGRIFWIQVQDPGFASGDADLIVMPRHDGDGGANAFVTLGAVHRVTPARLADGAHRFEPSLAHLKRPLIAVLLGGDNRVYRLTAARLSTLIGQLTALAKQGYGLAITTSRRSGSGVAMQLRQALPDAFVWSGDGDNPYFGLLALADAVIVTADSVNMVSEAATTGKPVHIVELDGGSAKFARFHAAMREANATRPFTGTIERWSYAPLDDTARAAAEAARRFKARRPA
ncbi:MAG TPA: mitochondrial fission ELM1 family protein [Stellaceae bacterium]|nr:mitochondrial fission ELM1 family protein [Stellaceae bacterium]